MIRYLTEFGRSGIIPINSSVGPVMPQIHMFLRMAATNVLTNPDNPKKKFRICVVDFDDDESTIYEFEFDEFGALVSTIY